MTPAYQAGALSPLDGRYAAAVEPFGFKYRHSAGLDMLVDARNPKAKSAVRLHAAEISDFSPPVTAARERCSRFTDFVFMRGSARLI